MRFISFLWAITFSCSVWGQIFIPANDELKGAVNRYFQSYEVRNYRPSSSMAADSINVCDSIRAIRITVNEPFASQPITSRVIDDVYEGLLKYLPSPYTSYRLSIVNSKGEDFKDLLPNYLRKDIDKSRLWKGIEFKGNSWVRNSSRPLSFPKGLDGHHIVVWASHGRYSKEKSWAWQRPRLFGTCEDLFTQTIVLPYLIPMLEKAGAIVYTPRERDWQKEEIIVDNDDNGVYGDYIENSQRDFSWTSTPDSGFALKEAIIHDKDNPFMSGTARQIVATSRRSRTSQVLWIPTIPADGKYAVYVSYVTRPNSIPDAQYTVYHCGERTSFTVNQKMGGSTWVYLGTFFFKKGKSNDCRISLSNLSDYQGVVTADAVRFGGGMGNIDRGAGLSCMPRYAEGSRYFALWAGMPYNVYSSKDGKDDYADDINARSYSLNYLGGGSPYIVSQTGCKVPFELSLAVHSDAGIRRDNSVYGSLAICTLKNSYGNTDFRSGVSRSASYDFASMLLSNTTHDLSSALGINWTRRELWNRNYSETRNPEVPSAIFETLSHQNFTDMKYGHDPNFKFLLARSIYKSIVQFTAFQHGLKRCVVAPLPVANFSIRLVANNKVQLSWAPQNDSLCDDALPTGYIVYTKTGNGDFDNGLYIKNKSSIAFSIMPGVIYSYKVCAVNDGGESFPSEILPVYISPNPAAKTVLIVNGFDRLSGPAVVNTVDSLGFDLSKDIGVPYIRTAGFCGNQFNYSPQSTEWGASSSEMEGHIYMGNTFNFPYEHGLSIKEAGLSFASCSRGAFCQTKIDRAQYPMIDLIEGLQQYSSTDLRYYKTFDYLMQKSITDYCNAGGSLFVSGSYIGTDMRSLSDSTFSADVLKYKYAASNHTNVTDTISGFHIMIPYYQIPNETHYAAQNVDAIEPIGSAFTAFNYSNGQSAGIAWKGDKYRTLSIGFPFECISDETTRNQTMAAVIRFLLE